MSGGTYSVYRAAYGLFLAVHFIGDASRASAPWAVAIAVIGALSSLPFALGVKDRWAALVMVPAILVAGMDHETDGIVVPLVALAPLAVHLGLVSAPYGSVDAIGRPDPAGDFVFPSAVRFVVYALLGGAYVAIALTAPKGRASSYADLGFAASAGLYLVLGLAPKTRFAGWAIMLGALVGHLFVADDPLTTPLLFVHFLAVDPKGIKPRGDVTGERVFYDGSCGLCHRAVRFILAEDPKGETFRFAPLGGDAFRAEVPRKSQKSLPDSIVLLTRDGQVLVRSEAILRMMEGLGGLWRVVAVILRAVPRPLRDLGYDGVAAVRYRLFARPLDTCPIIPERLRPRFDP